MPIRVLVADDHEVVRRGLKSLFEGTEFKISGEATSGEDAIQMTLKQKPDVVLMDVRLEGMDGITAMGRLMLDRPEQPVLIFSTYDNPTYVARAHALGAAGYLLKTVKNKRLLESLKLCAEGENAWTREELRRVQGALTTPRVTGDVEAPLTQRESDVLKQMAHGLTNKEIAQSLGISYETVKEHVQHILRKIGVTDRTQAAVWAVRKGMV